MNSKINEDLCVSESVDLYTYRYIVPELGYIKIIGPEELGKPGDGSLASFVYGFISLKVLVVFVDRVICQVHVQLAL